MTRAHKRPLHAWLLAATVLACGPRVAPPSPSSEVAPALEGRLPAGCERGFVDARAIGWCAVKDAITRVQPDGTLLSQTPVGAPLASAAEAELRTWLIPRPGGALAISSDGDATMLDADGRATSSRSLAGPVIFVEQLADGDVVIAQPSLVTRRTSELATRWSWRPPAGRVLDARLLASSGARSADAIAAERVSCVLDTGVEVTLPIDSLTADAQPVGATPATRWGYFERGTRPSIPLPLPVAAARPSFRFTRAVERPRDRPAAGALLARADGSFVVAEASGAVTLIGADGTARTTTLPSPPSGLHWAALELEESSTAPMLSVMAMGTGALDFDSAERVSFFAIEVGGQGAPRARALFDLTAPEETRAIGQTTFASRAERWTCVATTTLGSDCRVHRKDQTGVVKDRRESLPFMVHSVASLGEELVILAMVPDRPHSTELVARVKVRAADGALRDLGLEADATPVRMIAHALDDIWVLTRDHALHAADAERARAPSDPLPRLGHFDGRSWSVIATPLSDALDVASPAPGELVVVGLGGVVTRSGDTWTSVLGAPSGALAVTASRTGAIAVASRDAVYVGAREPDNRHRLADARTVADSRPRVTEAARVHRSPRSLRVVSKATAAPSGWSCAGWACPRPEAPRSGAVTLDDVRAVARSPSGAAWVTTSPGSTIGTIHRVDEAQGVDHYAGAPEDWLVAVTAPSDTDVWFAGGAEPEPRETSLWPRGSGVLVHFDGAAFTRIDTGPGALLAVDMRDGDAWGVGLGGAVVRVTRDAVRTWRIPGAPILRAVLVLGGDDVWLVGDRSTVLHYDGERFERVEDGLPSALLSFTSVTKEGDRVRVGGPAGALDVVDRRPAP